MRDRDTACTTAREWLSAARDGEAADEPTRRAHLQACDACAAWALRLDRQVGGRAGYAAPPAGLDVVAAAMAAFDARHGARRDLRERVGVAVLALAGVSGIVLSALSLGAIGDHTHQDLLGFQLAISVGFLLCAHDPSRYGRGLLAVSAAVSLIVLLPSAAGTAAGGLDLLAEASHLPVLVGLLGLLLLLDTVRGGEERPPRATSAPRLVG